MKCRNYFFYLLSFLFISANCYISTEGSVYCAWRQHFGSGGQGSGSASKANSQNVRAIRVF